MPVVKKIKIKDENNSYNTYPIGMNWDSVTIPTGIGGLTNNITNLEETLNILKDYANEQIENIRYNFLVNYIDESNITYNLKLFSTTSNPYTDVQNVIYNALDNFSIYNLDIIQQPITPNITSFSNLFPNWYICDNTVSVNTIQLFNLTNAVEMFAETTITDINVLNFGSNITNTSNTFYFCDNLKTINTMFNTNNVTNMVNMFYDCYNLVNIPNFNTSNVTNAYRMFEYCSNLINIPNFNTGKITDTRRMFFGCYNLINIPNLNLSNVGNASQMFQRCYNLTNISNLNLSNAIYLNYLCSDCLNLVNVYNLRANNVINMGYMFDGCDNLLYVNMVNTSSLKVATNMFIDCINVTEINGLNLVNANNLYMMFDECYHLSNNTVLNIAMNLPYFNNITYSRMENYLWYFGLGLLLCHECVIQDNSTAYNYITNRGWCLDEPSYTLYFKSNQSDEDEWTQLWVFNFINLSANGAGLRDLFNNGGIYETWNSAYINDLDVQTLQGIRNLSNVFSSAWSGTASMRRFSSFT